MGRIWAAWKKCHMNSVRGVFVLGADSKRFQRGNNEMSLNSAAAIDPVNNRRPRKSSGSSSAPVPLRIAERPVRDRVLRLVDLAMSLLKEAEMLARDTYFTEQSNKLQTFDLADGVDFYREVERFETGLIRLALEQTHGNQARAAKLLHIKPTTLNTKIKQFGIEY